MNHTAAPVRTRVAGDGWLAGRVLELEPKSAVTLFADASRGAAGAADKEKEVAR